MSQFKNFLKGLWQDESGQGATEYILLLVVVVSLAFIFRGRIESAITQKVEEVGGRINAFGQ